jgi:hypothetical protein
VCKRETLAKQVYQDSNSYKKEMYNLGDLDVVQSNILGIVANLMLNYNLNPAQVGARYEFLATSMGVKPTAACSTGDPSDQYFVPLNDEGDASDYESESESESEDWDKDAEEASFGNGNNQEEESEQCLSNASATETLSEEESPEDNDHHCKTKIEEEPAEDIEAKIKRWGDLELEPMKTPLIVTTRREFCNAMQNGIKICPRYSTCVNPHCKSFHVPSDRICPHVTRGSYCENSQCDLIVIRACRKGKRCNDSGCSFRHP